MRCLSLLVIAALAGCQKDEGFEPMMNPMDQADIPARVEIGSAVGHETVYVPVRLVNAFGVAITGGSVELSVTGEGLTVQSSSVSFDYSGVGWLEVSGVVPQSFTVSAVSSSDGASLGDPATSWLVGGALPELGLPPAWPIGVSPDRIVASWGGVAWAQDNVVWWQPNEPGAPALAVATLQSPVDGIRGVDVDSDGLKDLVAWSGTQAIALRGSGDGGFTWGVGFDAVDGVIVDASAGLLDGDVTAELVFAWSEGSRGGLQAFSGDGVWGFEAIEPWELAEDPWSIGVGDFGGTGIESVAVMSEGNGEGIVRRMGIRTDGWVGVGQELEGDEVAQSFRNGGQVEGVIDVNGDGYDELVFGQQAEDNTSRTLYMVRFDNGVLVYDFRYSRLRAALGDLSGDGLGDLLITEDDPGGLHLVTTDSEDGSLFNRSLAAELPSEALAIAELSGDGLPDFVMAREGRVELHRGEISDDTGLWRIADEGLTSLLLSSIGPSYAGDFDGDGAMDVLVFREAGSSVYLQRFRGTYDASNGVGVDTNQIDRVEVSGASGQAVDLAVCGDTAYALVDRNGVSLHVIDIGGGALQAVGSASVPDGVAVACGSLDIGDGAAVLTSADEAVIFSRSANELDRLSVELGAEDIAVVSVGGETWLQTCSTEGCSLLSDDLDGDGDDEWLIANEDDALIMAWGTEHPLTVSGQPSAFDVDGDGRKELVLVSGDQVAIVRTLTGSFAPPALLHSRSPLTGAASWADVDGDGLGELLLPGEGGRVLVSWPSSEQASD